MKDGNLRVERFHFRHGLPIAGLPILKIAREGDHDVQPYTICISFSPISTDWYSNGYCTAVKCNSGEPE